MRLFLEHAAESIGRAPGEPETGKNFREREGRETERERERERERKKGREEKRLYPRLRRTRKRSMDGSGERWHAGATSPVPGSFRQHFRCLSVCSAIEAGSKHDC